MCRVDNDDADDDEYCNFNALLRFLIISNNMITDLLGFNFKTIIIIAEYPKMSTFKAIRHSAFIGICS